MRVVDNSRKACPYCDKNVAGHLGSYLERDYAAVARHVKKFHKRKYIKDNWK
jgi:hypothetical protein